MMSIRDSTEWVNLAVQNRETTLVIFYYLDLSFYINLNFDHMVLTSSQFGRL